MPPTRVDQAGSSHSGPSAKGVLRAGEEWQSLDPYERLTIVVVRFRL